MGVVIHAERISRHMEREYNSEFREWKLTVHNNGKISYRFKVRIW